MSFLCCCQSPSPRQERRNVVSGGGNNIPNIPQKFPLPGDSPKMEPHRLRKASDGPSPLAPAPKVRFHENLHGKNIMVSRRGTKASRTDGFYDGIIFSHRPLVVNETISFKITDVDKYRSGCLAVGMTLDAPERWGRTIIELPSSAEFMNKSGTKYVRLDEKYCRNSSQFNLRLTEHGDVHFLSNEDNHEFSLLSKIDISKPVWLFMEIFGRCTTLEVANDPVERNGPGRKPEAKIKPFRQQSVVNIISIGEYEYVEEPINRLGQGMFGEVWKGIRTKDDLGVSLKKLPFDPKQEFKTELEVMETVSHPNLLKMLGTMRRGPYFYIITELCSMDFDRFMKLHLPPGKWSLDNLKTVAKQLSSGYVVLHAAEIIHRDIKPQNILVNVWPNNKATLKIADFGCGKFMDGELYAQTVAGTVLYMAPELGTCWASKSDFSHYDARADIWSLGLVLYECSVGQLPYNQKNILQFFVAAGKSPRQAKKMKPKIPGHLDSHLQQLLSKMLKPLYKDRMMPADFFQDPFHFQVPLHHYIFF